MYGFWHSFDLRYQSVILMYVYAYACIHVYMDAHVNACTDIRIHIYMHIRTYIHTYIQMYVSMHIIICMHTYGSFYTHIGIPFNNGSVE